MRTRSVRFSVLPARKVSCCVTTKLFCSMSSKSMRRMVTCSPFGPKGIDLSPSTHAANSSLAFHQPVRPHTHDDGPQTVKYVIDTREGLAAMSGFRRIRASRRVGLD